jgi:hypothetical protein
MTPTSLKALRNLLFFTVQDAARLIAVSPDQPEGVSDTAWQQWEDGSQPIPEFVVTRMNELNDWRSMALDATADNIRVQMKEKGGTPESIFVIWYDRLEDWKSMPNREPVMWRLQQAVCAALLGMFSIVKLIPFDAQAYALWLAGREDSESLRAEWAGTLQ